MFINDYRVIRSMINSVNLVLFGWSPSKSDSEYKLDKIIRKNFSFFTNFTKSIAGYPQLSGTRFSVN